MAECRALFTGFVSEMSTKVYTHAEAKELVARIIITDVEAVHAVCQAYFPL